MFAIERDGSTVRVIVTPAFPIQSQPFSFKYDAGVEWAALLVWNNLREKQMKELHRIREEAYAEGWKDAKAHKVKQTWFSSMWSS